MRAYTPTRLMGVDRFCILTNGDGASDLTINLTGLNLASQISASDFLFN